jgi:hypothetical protein
MVEIQELDVPRGQRSPLPYFIRMTAFVTCALTVAGGSWYVAVNMTTPSDLTAIYNCSAFFAYAFSVPLLKEKLKWDKSFAVLIAIIGVLVVAYGGKNTPADPDAENPEREAENRLLGNIIIGIGSVLYGLYEVLYKRLACPPEGTSPGRGMIFANTFGSLIGAFTLSVLWIPLPILHYTGLETFQLPRGERDFLRLVPHPDFLDQSCSKQCCCTLDDFPSRNCRLVTDEQSLVPWGNYWWVTYNWCFPSLDLEHVQRDAR